MEDKFDQELISTIKEKHLTPKPRWQFLLKNYVIWSACALSLVIGSLAVSVIIYLVRYNDWDLYDELNGSFWQFALLTLPYFWLIILVLFVFIIYYNIKHTKKGYRYSVILTITTSIIISIMGGGLFFRIGFGQYIDDILGERSPFYQGVFNRQINLWDQPENGHLMGLVSETKNNEFVLIDIHNQQWIIKLSETVKLPPTGITVGQPIRIIGQILPNHTFSAQRFLPVGPGRGIFKRHHSRLDWDMTYWQVFYNNNLNPTHEYIEI